MADVVDVHAHWFPPSVVPLARPAGIAGGIARAWPALVDLGAQLEAAEEAGIATKVLSAPYSSLLAAAKGAAGDLPTRTNDALADAVREHPGRLAAFATVDVFRGDEAAEEARRAVDELGLSGLLVDTVQGEKLLTAPEARPTLAFAAERGLLVFAHPVTPEVVPPRFSAEPGVGVLLARGTESALSTLALLRSTVLDELPGLHVLLAGIGAAGLLLAPFLDAPDDDPPPSARRRRLHLDTMGFDPAGVRLALDLVGPEQVLAGSDWPIMWRDASAARVASTLEAAVVAPETGALVAGGNARRLLGLA